MKSYNIKGDFIFPDLIKDGTYNKYDITLMNNEHVYIYTLLSQIAVIQYLTVDEHRTIFNEFGFETTVFIKHIVKITEVK